MSAETTELWWHLLNVHGLGAGMTHGDPGLMHYTLHSGIIGADHGHEADCVCCVGCNETTEPCACLRAKGGNP